MSSDVIQRTVLPIPAQGHVGSTTYDAKDPEASFADIEPLRPPTGAPNVLTLSGRIVCGEEQDPAGTSRSPRNTAPRDPWVARPR